MSTYDFSYALRRRIRRRIFIGVLYVFALFFVFSFINKRLIFSVAAYNSTLPENSSRLELCFVTPLAIPLSHTETSIPVLTPIFHSVDLKRGNVVYVLPQYPQKLSPFKSFVNAFIGFITFQQYFPFSKSGNTAQNPSLRRLVALPGDTVYMNDFMLYVKPAGDEHFLTEFELAANQYDILIKPLPIQWDTLLGAYGVFDKLTLGPQEYFVLDDNRTEALDSRIWGPVPAHRIGGRAFLRFFPFNRFSLL